MKTNWIVMEMIRMKNDKTNKSNYGYTKIKLGLYDILLKAGDSIDGNDNDS